MSDVFLAFGFSSISPAAIKTYGQDPGLFFARYIRKVKEDMGPAAWRGDAVEAGFNAVLYGREKDAFINASITFEKRSEEWSKKNGGEVHPDHDAEAAKVALCLERAIAAREAEPLLKDAGVPASYQSRCEVTLPGAPIAITGYWDWGFGKIGEGFSMDLKTANSIPSEQGEDDERPNIDPDHGIQFSCYAKSRGESSVSGLYVLAKPFASGYREEDAINAKTKEPEKRYYHKSTKKRLQHAPDTDAGRAEIKALDAQAAEGKRTHILVTLNQDDIDFYCNAAVQTLLSMESVMTAALAMPRYEMVTPEEALARLCRPNLLAKGGGLYPLWKQDHVRACRDAVPEWGI